MKDELDLTHVKSVSELQAALTITIEEALRDVSIVLPLSVARQLMRLAKAGQEAADRKAKGGAKRQSAPRQEGDSTEARAEARKMLLDGHPIHRVAESTGLAVLVVNGLRRGLQSQGLLKVQSEGE